MSSKRSEHLSVRIEPELLTRIKALRVNVDSVCDSDAVRAALVVGLDALEHFAEGDEPGMRVSHTEVRARVAAVVQSGVVAAFAARTDAARGRARSTGEEMQKPSEPATSADAERHELAASLDTIDSDAPPVPPRPRLAERGESSLSRRPSC